MVRRKLSNRTQRRNKQQGKQRKQKNKAFFREVLAWFSPKGEFFTKDQFHGNIKWEPEQLVSEALIWSWQETRNVTDAFGQTLEVCEELGSMTKRR
jgi:hypothetical protein